MVKVDDSLYREVAGCHPEGRKVWEFRIPFSGRGQTLDVKPPNVRAWEERFGRDRWGQQVEENPSFSTHECDWKKARKLAVKYAASMGVSLVEVKVPRDILGGE